MDRARKLNDDNLESNSHELKFVLDYSSSIFSHLWVVGCKGGVGGFDDCSKGSKLDSS